METTATRPVAPGNSIQGGSEFVNREILLLRIPVTPDAPLLRGLEASTDSGSTLLASHSSYPQHFAFVRSTNTHPDGLEVEVYPVVSFTRSGGARAGYDKVDDDIKPTLIPLPPLSHTFQTPKLFGPPLVIGGWIGSRDAWVSVTPIKFILPMTRAFKRFDPPVMMSIQEFRQIDMYRNALATPRIEPDNTLSSDTLSIPEVEGAGEEIHWPTMKDDLILLAHTSPSWARELEKHVEAENNERAEVHEERLLRLENWLQVL